MAQVSVRQARDNLSQLIKDAQAGEEIVIASHGTPVARIVPVGGSAHQLGRWLMDHPPAGGRTVEEIDDYLDGERASWE